MKLKAYNVITVVCVLTILSVSLGIGYAQYTSTLSDNETVTVNNHYGTVTISGTPGHYILNYEDTDANEAILSMKISGLSSDYSPGTQLDLWLGDTDAIGEFGTRYTATVADSELTSLVRPLGNSESVYTDSGTEYTVTCSAGVIRATKGGQPLAVVGQNFVDGSAIYSVTLSGDTVTGVNRVITVNGSSGTYSFSDGGYGYAVVCSGSSVTSAVKCDVISAEVDGLGVVEFGARVIGLAGNHWQQSVTLRCGGTAADIGAYSISAVFYSIELEVSP